MQRRTTRLRAVAARETKIHRDRHSATHCAYATRAKLKYIAIVTVQIQCHATHSVRDCRDRHVCGGLHCHSVGSAHDTDDHRAKSAHETDDRDQMTTCRDNCVIVNLTLFEPEPEAEPRARAIDLERE